MTSLQKLLIAASAALTLTLGAVPAQALNVTGNYGNAGYSVVNFNASGGTTDITFNGGFSDATFSVFTGAGSHLISNDDANNSLNPHITQNLAAGSYSLLISYCCSVFGEVHTNGSGTSSNTDGFNLGTYELGGTSTLASTMAYLDNIAAISFPNGFASIANGQTTYDVTLTNATNDVPEPGSLVLMGLALAGLALRRKATAPQ